MVKAINAIDHGLAKAEKLFVVVNGVLLFLLMTWCVIARYILHLSAPYQTELAQTFHIWLCFVASSLLFSTNENSSVDIFPDKVMRSKNMTFKKVYFTLIYLTDLILVYPCLKYGIKNIPRYYAQKTVNLGYSYIFVYGAAIVGFALIAFRILLCVLDIWSGQYFEKYGPKTEEGGADK